MKYKECLIFRDLFKIRNNWNHLYQQHSLNVNVLFSSVSLPHWRSLYLDHTEEFCHSEVHAMGHFQLHIHSLLKKRWIIGHTALNKTFMEVDGIGQLGRFHCIINNGTQIVSLKKSQSAANIWNFPWAWKFTQNAN